MHIISLKNFKQKYVKKCEKSHTKKFAKKYAEICMNKIASGILLVNLLFFLTLTFFPNVTYSADLNIDKTTESNLPVLNAGLVNGLWFSKTPFFAGETIRVYTAFQNQSGLDITGDIVFYNNNTAIAKKSFNSVNGQVIQSWADWKVTEGNHNIYIEIEQAKSTEIGGEPKPIVVQVKKFDKVPIFADLDTDRDNIGNTVDSDDDGDGISDVKEIERGTNPLLSNSEKPLDMSARVNNILDNLPIADNDIKKTLASTTTNTLNIIDKIANSLRDSAIQYKSNIDKDLEKNSENQKNIVKDSSTASTTVSIPASTLKKKTPIENYKAENLDATPSLLVYLKGAISLLLSLVIAILSHTFSLYLTICFLVYLIWRIVKRLMGR